MRGKRLTVDEAKALPLGTKVVVVRGNGWHKDFQGSSIEKLSVDEGKRITTVDNSGSFGWVHQAKRYSHLETDYYEYIEGSSTNEETI